MFLHCCPLGRAQLGELISALGGVGPLTHLQALGSWAGVCASQVASPTWAFCQGASILLHVTSSRLARPLVVAEGQEAGAEVTGPLEATSESHSITCAAFCQSERVPGPSPDWELGEAQTLAPDGRSCRESVVICFIHH